MPLTDAIAEAIVDIAVAALEDDNPDRIIVRSSEELGIQCAGVASANGNGHVAVKQWRGGFCNESNIPIYDMEDARLWALRNKEFIGSVANCNFDWIHAGLDKRILVVAEYSATNQWGIVWFQIGEDWDKQSIKALKRLARLLLTIVRKGDDLNEMAECFQESILKLQVLANEAHPVVAV